MGWVRQRSNREHVLLEMKLSVDQTCCAVCKQTLGGGAAEDGHFLDCFTKAWFGGYLHPPVRPSRKHTAVSGSGGGGASCYKLMSICRIGCWTSTTAAQPSQGN